MSFIYQLEKWTLDILFPREKIKIEIYIFFLYSNLKACNSTTFQFTLFLLECKYYFRHLIIFKPMLFDSSGCFNSFLSLNWQSKILYLYKYDYFNICVILYREFVFSILCWNCSMKCLIKENQTSIN